MQSRCSSSCSVGFMGFMAFLLAGRLKFPVLLSYGPHVKHVSATNCQSAHQNRSISFSERRNSAETQNCGSDRATCDSGEIRRYFPLLAQYGGNPECISFHTLLFLTVCASDSSMFSCLRLELSARGFNRVIRPGA